MKTDDLVVSGGHVRRRSCWRSVPRSSGRGRMADGGDAPDRSPSPSTPVVIGRRAASFADRAGPLGRRHAAADRQPDRRHGLAGRYRSPGACSTSSRPVRSRRAWPSRTTAVAAWSPTGTATTWPCSRSRTTRSRWPAASRSAPSRGASRLTADGSTAYVAVGVSNEVVRVDLNGRQGHRPAAGRPRAARDRPLARRVAAPGRQRPVAGRLARSTRKTWTVEQHDSDRRRQPPAGRHQRRRQDGLHRQHAQSPVPHDPEQHRPGLGPRPAADPRPARRLGHLRHALARHAGQGRRATPTASRSAATTSSWRSVAAARTRS